MRICDILEPRNVKLALAARDQRGALEEMVDLLSSEPEIATRREEILEALERREKLVTTAIGRGVAIPHAELSTPIRTIGAVGISSAGIDYGAPDGRPVHIVFLIVVSREQSHERIEALSAFSRMMRNEQVRREVREAPSADSLIAALCREGDGRAS